MSGAPTRSPPADLLTSSHTVPEFLTTDDDDSNLCLDDLQQYVNKTITKIKPMLQTGPNCGLAALAMVATLIPIKQSISINNIFHEAELRGFTCKGEMFSVSNMKILAETFLAPWFCVEEFSDGMEAKKLSIIEKLYAGALMMVPYDADKNHSPCCMNGHKAHWAVVCGVMEGSDGQVHVAARHGKSRYLGVWSLDSLANSNANLTELDPSRRKDNCQYILPSGGVRAGLSNRYILITKK